MPWGLDYAALTSVSIKSGLYACFKEVFNGLKPADRTGDNYLIAFANHLSANYANSALQPKMVAPGVVIPNIDIPAIIPDIYLSDNWNDNIVSDQFRGVEHNPLLRGGVRKLNQTKRRLSKKYKRHIVSKKKSRRIRR
jgi:hypothetical protein